VAFCTGCGNSVSDTDQFCRSCGAPQGASLPGRQSAPAQPGPTPAAVPSAAASVGQVAARAAVPAAMYWAIAAVVVAAAVGGIAGYPAWQRHEAAAVAERFINAVDQKDMNTALSCMDPMVEKQYKSVGNITQGLLGVSLSDVANLVPLLFSGMQEITGDQTNYHMRVVQVVSDEVSGDSATVVLRVEMTNVDQNGATQTTTQNLSAKLRHFDVGWRIVQ